MNFQSLIESGQELTAGGGNTGGGADSGKTGTLCTITALYKATDGKTEFIIPIDANTYYPAYPGGNGTGKTVWSRLSVTTDGSKTGFESVKVAAGTV